MINKKKHFILAVWISLLTIIFTQSALASETEALRRGVTVQIDSNQANAHGSLIRMPTNVVLDGHTTMIPYRFFYDALGIEVDWNSKREEITYKENKNTIRLVLDSDTAIADGKKVKLENPAKIINGFVMVPLRYVAESFGWKVGFIAKTNTITLNNKNLVHVYIADDSATPQRSNSLSDIGWRDEFAELFSKNVVVHEETTLDDKTMETILAEIGKEEVLFIQIGYNGKEPDLAKLQQQVEQVQAAEATPIVLTPLGNFAEQDSMLHSYIDTLKIWAKQNKIRIIDLDEKNKTLYTEWSKENAKQIRNDSDGSKARELFLKKSSSELAQYVVDVIRSEKLPLAKQINRK